MKKILSCVLLLCMLSTCMVCAAEPTPDFEEQSMVVEPFSSKLVLNSSIARKTTTWSQSNGYTAYRVWVENTTSVETKVTIVDSKNKTQAFYVPSKGSKTFTDNHAVTGKYTISFYTGNIAPAGSVRVRVSTESLL